MTHCSLLLLSPVWVAVLIFLLAVALPSRAAPKNVLVVTVTTGYRHSSIPTAEKVIGELARASGLFRVEYARVEPADPQFKGADGKPDKARAYAAVKEVLAEKLSRAALESLDAVVFANTTGDLPLPDLQAFLDWIKSGKGFVGMHSASDTLLGSPAYIDMIGGAFNRHGPQVEVEAINQDPQCPACRPFGARWRIYEEIYQFKAFDRAKVHGLLTLDRHPHDRTPGDYPISWCKFYGQGRVFYTSLGHREDIWDPDTPETFERKNSREDAKAYQQHILEGIKWALGLEEWKPGPTAAPVR